MHHQQSLVFQHVRGVRGEVPPLCRRVCKVIASTNPTGFQTAVSAVPRVLRQKHEAAASEQGACIISRASCFGMCEEYGARCLLCVVVLVKSLRRQVYGIHRGFQTAVSAVPRVLRHKHEREAAVSDVPTVLRQEHERAGGRCIARAGSCSSLGEESGARCLACVAALGFTGRAETQRALLFLSFVSGNRVWRPSR